MTEGVKEEPQETTGVEAEAEPIFDPVAHYFSASEEPRSLRALLSLTLQARRMARRAGPRVYYLMAVFEVMTAVLLGAQVILGKLALEAIIQTRTSGEVGPALAPLIGFLAASAFSTLATSGVSQLQRLQGEQVQRQTWESILSVTTSVDLETFESPDFFDQLQRVEANALIRPLELAQGLTQVGAGALGTVGLSIALLILQPILLPILLLSGVPLWLRPVPCRHTRCRSRAARSPSSCAPRTRRSEVAPSSCCSISVIRSPASG